MIDLLSILKDIEYNTLNRVKKFDNGPRTIDLDILLYDNSIVNLPELNIPHIRMIERSFVLVPLCELLPVEFIHPLTAEPIHDRSILPTFVSTFKFGSMFPNYFRCKYIIKLNI